MLLKVGSLGIKQRFKAAILATGIMALLSKIVLSQKFETD
jgi:hypothetical protein